MLIQIKINLVLWCLPNLLKKKVQLYATRAVISCRHSSRYSQSITFLLQKFFFRQLHQSSTITEKQEVTLEKYIKCSYIRRQIPSFSWRNYFLLHIVTYQICKISPWKRSMFCWIILGLCWHKSEQKSALCLHDQTGFDSSFLNSCNQNSW